MRFFNLKNKPWLACGKRILIFLLIIAWIFSGWPPLWQNSRVPPVIKKAQAAPIVTYLTNTALTSWDVPADWNPGSNTIEVIGGGGGGANGSASSPGVGGGGGASGAYAKVSNLDISGSITIQIGTAGGVASAGSDTYFNGANCAGSDVCGKGGGAASGQTKGSAQAGSVGDTVNAGADGGDGGSTGPTNGGGGGGGGGAGGPSGAGVAGATSSSQDGGAGGDGGAGSGGAGGTANGGAGGNGTEWSSSPDYGSGGGGGGGQGGGNKGNGSAGGAGGTYGAGGAGGGGMGKGGANAGAGTAGKQGIIVITYTPAVTTIAKSGSQDATLYIDTTDNHIGGAFTIQTAVGTVNITSITLTETGTITADDDLSNAKLYYETAATCTYDGDETQFSTAQSFSSEEATFGSDTMTVGTSQVCVYVILDIGSGAAVAETISIEINSSSDATVSSGTIDGSFPVNLGSSELQMPPPIDLDQYAYRWRNDDGGEGVVWYDDSWSYRKTIPIANATTTILTDYQVKITVASSTSGDVTCSGNCQSDFDDVRFTASDGVTLLDYWRESYVASTDSIFWVEIPSLSAEATSTIYMYYGNGAVSTTSNGDNTFRFFDDFESGYPGTKWTGETDYGSVTDGILSYYSGVGSWKKMYSASQYSPSYALRSKSKLDNTGGFGLDQAIGFEANPCCSGRALIYGTGLLSNDDAGTGSVSTGHWSYDTWYIFDVNHLSGSSIALYVDGDLKVTKTDYVGTLDQNVSIGSYRARNYTDWILVREYVDPEPTIGTPGSQETSGGATWMAAENTLAVLTSEEQAANVRVRFLIKNAGGPSGNINYRLQYAALGGNPNCLAVAGDDFSDVATTTGGVVQIVTSDNFGDQDSTVNFSGSLTDPGGYSWVDGKMVESPSNQTDSVNLGLNNFTELEYNFKFTESAPDGTSYCFRVAQITQGYTLELDSYANIARISTKADTVVTSVGEQTASLQINSASNYLDGGFSIREFTGTRNVTEITITEQGTIDAQNDLANIKLFYDLDTTEPYNCASESYEGDEEQFGSTVAGGFSSANGTSTFTGTVGISTTSTMCVYVVLDVGSGASVGETIEVQITDPSTEVKVSSGTVGPPSTVAISGTTELVGLAQVHYRWREDTGGEALGDWPYKKSVVIENFLAAELTDFQVKIEVGYQSSDGGDVDCEGKCRTDFGDIRFINSDYSQLLDYWQEKYTASATSTFWVKIPSLTAEATSTIYMFYGNSGVSTTSNGENTFVFFDDFEDDTFEDDWEIQWSVGRNYWDEVGGVLTTLMDQARFIYLKNFTSDNSNPGIHEFKVKWNSSSTGTHLAGQVWHWNTPSPGSIFYRTFYFAPGPAIYMRYVDTDLGSSPISYTGSYDEWYKFSLKIKGSGNYNFKIEKSDGTNVTSADFSNSSATSGKVGLGGFGTGSIEAYYDDYRIRKYASTEPTVVSTGLEAAGGTGWLAAEDTAATIDKNTNVRVRFLVRNSGAAVNSANYRLQYAALGEAASCLLVDSGNFADVATTTGGVAQMMDSSWFVGCPEASQASTTPQLTAVSGATFVGGNMVDNECNQTASFNLATDYYTEHEFNFKFTDSAPDSTAYCFRLAKVSGGETAGLDSYLQIARISTAEGAAGVSISIDISEFDYGWLEANTASSTLALWGGAGIVATNGDVLADFYIYGANTGGWTLDAATSTPDYYTHKFCNETDNDCAASGPYGADFTALTTNPQLLKASIAPDGQVAFQLSMHTPNPSTIYTQQSAQVTIQVSAP
ncbi:MAG: DUF2341 domain-containing protein [Patescibacteria group bacterium]|nr:DUF2341 domain-containing protein [Patescibacteria group bacterium]